MRPALKWGMVAVVALCCAGVAWHFGRQSGSAPAQSAVQQSETNTLVVKQTHTLPPALPNPIATESAPVVTPTTIPAAPAIEISVASIPIDPALTALAAGLKGLSGTNVAFSTEAVGAWRTNLMQLVQSGPSAVPALRAFLQEKNDFAFSREAAQATGYPSARVAAIDALRQIGGPDAIATMEGLLSSTQSPRDIAVLARNLDESQPGQYREQALSAARSALQAATLSRDPQLDVAPLFEVFQKYGDASAIPDLENAMGQWKYYSTIALANLPDGAGIPSILRMADPASGSGNRIVALEMVAQLAAENPAAREFLIAQASGNNISPNIWPYLMSPLSGDQYFPVDSAITLYPQLQSWGDLKTTRINSGNQNLYLLPGYQSLSQEAINGRLDLVSQLLQTASDPAAVRALQQARETLSRRSTRAAAVTQPGNALGQ